MQPSYSDNSDSPDDSVHPSDTVTNDPIDLGTFFSTFNALFDAYIRPDTHINELDSSE